MGRLTVSEIIDYSIENGGKKTLLKLSKTNSKGLSAAELKPYIKRMDEYEAEQSVLNLVKAFMRNGGDHKPELGYFWFGADEDDFDLGGGRRRRRKRGGVPLGHRCGTNADCDEGLQCVLQDLLSGPQVDNNQRGVCKTSEGGRRRRRKRTRRKKKSKRRRRKRKRTKKKRRRRRRK